MHNNSFNYCLLTKTCKLLKSSNIEKEKVILSIVWLYQKYKN